MALTKDTGTEPAVRVPDAAPAGGSRPRPAVVAAFALVLLAVLGWQLMAHPTWTAPTRDPAWYDWRANVILNSSPGLLAREWGPSAVFSGGYRVTTPLAGALLERVAGIDQYSFSAFLMVGIPVLAGLALGAAAYRSRKDPLVVLIMMLATVALFLTTPYVGYLDNTLMLFLLCLLIAFIGPARTSWPARAAVFLIGMAAAFTHPTTSVLFGLTLLAVFGWHFLSSRFSLGRFSLAAAFRSDGPMLMSTGFGMIFGLALWFGVWGPAAKFSDAAAPPPYTKAFFLDRLKDWVLSLQPIVIVPFIAIAVASVVLTARRTRTAAGAFETVSIWWMLPFAGALTFLVSSKPVPYYRFMNATAALMPLVGLGAYIAIRRFLRLPGSARVAGVLASILVVGSLGWVLADGLRNRWVTEGNQWADQNTRIALAAVHEVAQAAGVRPNIIVVNFRDTNDETGTNPAYGWAKTYSNVYRSGLPGDAAQYSATYLGTVGNFLQGTATTGRAQGYTDWSQKYYQEVLARRAATPSPPVAFLYAGFYGKGSDPVQPALAQGTAIGPGVVVLRGPGLWQPPAGVVADARAAAAVEQRSLADHPSAFGDPVHTLRVLVGVFFLAILPGLVAAPFFELDDTVIKVSLVPGISIVLTLLSGIALLAVWRGPLTTVKGWAVVALATGVAAGLRRRGPRVVAVLGSFGGFFDRMFAVFSNRSFSALMGTQFVAQAADGVVQASLAKTIAFGGRQGFDITTAPSTRYLLVAVLLLYVPYTVVSPFVGVLIDRTDRRALLSRSNLFRAAVVGAVALLLAGFGARLPAVVIIGAILVALACTRILLAIKSAGLPAVLKGKDLLQGNGLSQAGGAVFQVVGGGVALVGTAIAPSWIVALAGAAMYAVAGIVARQVGHLESERRSARLAEELRRVVAEIAEGLREVRGRPAGALALTAFQALRTEFFGFVALVFALQARFLLAGPKGDKTAIAIAGATGAVGAAIGMVLAQKLKDRVQPARLMTAAMTALGLGVIAFGGIQSIAGYSGLTFVGALGFFLGKISADTIMQQAMPDGFRGRAFSLFDLAYNFGWIAPAFVLYLVWGDGNHVRLILIGSGIAFLAVTAFIGRWARKLHGTLAPQKDPVGAPTH